MKFTSEDLMKAMGLQVGDKVEIILAVNHKLGRLEDLEDELGCPLDVVFKALKQRHIFVDMNIFEHCRPILQDIQKKEVNLITFNGTYFCIGNTHDYEVALKDYKKTWWLSSDLEE